MPNLMQNLRRLMGVDGRQPDRKQLEGHIMTPHTDTAGNTLRLTPEEIQFLGINPFEQTMDVYPVTSTSSAHGYLYLQSRALFDLLDEMVDRDTTIGGCLELIVAYMLMRPAGLTMSEEDTDKPGAKEAMELVQAQLLDGTNWNYMVWSLAEGLLRHGRATAEISWMVTAEGYYTPKQFYHCHPGQFTFDRDGKMYLSLSGDRQGHEPLHPLKFVTVARPALYDNPWGSSLIYPCRFLYHFKKRAMIYRLRYAENHGEPVYHAWVDAASAQNPEESRAKLAAALSSIGQNNFIVTTGGEHLQVHSRHGAGGGDQLHGSIAADYDNYMVLRLIGATLSTRTAENGTRALGEVHERTVLNRILPPAQMLVSAINEQIVDPWCELNLPPGSPRPYYYIDTEEDADAEAARDTLRTAVEIGLEVAVEEARERLGLRQPIEDEEVIGGTPRNMPGGLLEENLPPPARPAGTEPPAEGEEPDEDEVEEAASSSTTPAVTMARRSLGYVYLPLSEEETASVVSWARENIDKEDLAEDGVEESSHITLLCGLTDNDPEPVKRALLGCYPALAMYGPLRLFEREDADILYMEVDGWGLDELREELAKGVARDPNVEAAWDNGYIPHVTIARLKPGRGTKYTTMNDEDGQPSGESAAYGPLTQGMGILDLALFEDKKGDTHEFQLTGPYTQFSEGTGSLATELQERLQGQARPEGEPELLPTAYTARIHRFLAANTAATEEQLRPWIERLFAGCAPDSPRYHQTWDAIQRFCDLQRAQIEAETAGQLVHMAMERYAPAPVPTLAQWRSDSELRHVEFQRAFTGAGAMEKRLEAMARDLFVESREAMFKSLRRTLKNMDEMWVDNNAPLSARAYDAIDIEPLTDRVEEAARLLTTSSWMLAYAFARDTTATARAIREERKAPPRFLDDGPDWTGFADGDTDWKAVLRRWGPLFADAANWMLGRGIVSLRQLLHMVEMMMEETPDERAAIERQLRRDYLALAGLVDINMVKAVQSLIARAIKNGQTFQQFLNAMDVALSNAAASGGAPFVPGSLDSYLENVFRTEVSNAFNEQQRKQEAEPEFDDVLWGHLAGNPVDKRSDPTHARTNGVYYRKRSRAAQMLGTPPYRYRCRCYLTPLVDADPENSEFSESDNALEIALNVTRF